MTHREIKAVIIVSLVIALRLLGIFLVSPVFSIYAIRFSGATLPFVGLAFGIYALAQSLLQLPFGWASDRFGRKPLLLAGLVMFTIGSFLCARAENIGQLTLARAVQGTGAIGSVAMASLGDLTRPEVRTQAFTVTGIVIGSAFVVGLFGGPLLAAHFGLSGLFYLLALIGLLAILTTGLLFPKIQIRQVEDQGPGLRVLLQNIDVRKLCVAAFILSFTLNLFLFSYPLDWGSLGLDRSQLWKIYIVIFLPSLFLVFPYVRYAERRHDLQTPTRLGWLFMAGSYLIYMAGGIGRKILYLTGSAFFLGYTLFQPVLPSFLTQIVPTKGRGAGIGLYNLSGFLGAAFGGLLAGILHHFGHSLPGIAETIVLLGWPLWGLPKQPNSAEASHAEGMHTFSLSGAGQDTSRTGNSLDRGGKP